MKTISVLNFLIVLTSCIQSNSDVVGTYCARHRTGIDCIEIRKDGTFIQFYEFETEKKSNEGTWEFITQLGHEKIMLRGFVYYVLPYEDSDNLIGQKGSASMYWMGNEIGGDVNREYNYFREMEK